MKTLHRPSSPRVGLALALAFAASTSRASADTECDADPNRVFFEATVDPARLNDLLARLGNVDVNIGSAPLRFDGLCTDHQVNINTGFLQIPVAAAPFSVTPSLGRIQVQLDVPGPFQLGIDGRSYQGVNCDSACVVELPYVGEVFDGCALESDIVGPVVRQLNASAGWDDARITQIADTCVLGDCTAVHPVETTTASIFGFDVDLTGFGSCEIFLDFPDPFPDLGPFDPCDGFDPLIEDLLEPMLEEGLADAFVNREGEGILVNVFSRQIVSDGCLPIDEVRECRQAQTDGVGGLLRRPRSRALNAFLYLLPLGLVGGLALRARRRRG
jgi:hypothetical protein